jgi:hypothetical protein
MGDRNETLYRSPARHDAGGGLAVKGKRLLNPGVALALAAGSKLRLVDHDATFARP